MIPISRVLFLLAACGLLAPATRADDQPKPAEEAGAVQNKAEEAGEAAGVELRRVVLFSSGVGYFEHTGQVTGNSELSLKFEVDDVNDLLKSLVLEDGGGGTVSAVTYESRDPVTRTLRTFSVDLTENVGMADLLAQIRGAEVTVTIPIKPVL